MVEVTSTTPDRPRLGISPASDAPLRLVFYAGPVEPRRLIAVDPVLDGMLFPGLWSWLRLLGFGLRRLLAGWHRLVGSWGVAILLLSLSVKLLMWPLTTLAERWQTRGGAHPGPARAGARGDPPGVPRRGCAPPDPRGLSPARREPASTRSAAHSACLIQIPVFIAAFDMLGENIRPEGRGVSLDRRPGNARSTGSRCPSRCPSSAGL